MKNRIKILLIGIFLLGMGEHALSQDVHFSQRLAGDKQRNPAFTSQFDGSWQAFSVYRQQWQSIGVPFTTSALFLTKRFYTNKPPLQFYGGLILSNDQSGDSKLTSSQLHANAGASLELERDMFSFFVSYSYTFKSFNQDGLTFPMQYDREIGGFNESISSGESFQSETTSYHNLGVGGLWKRELNSRWDLTSGVSVLNILEPEESFFDGGSRKGLGYGFQSELEYKMSKGLNLLPYVSYYRTKGASEGLIGSAILLNTAAFGPIENIQPFIYVRTGIDRLSDAAIIGTSATLGDFQFGVSYDVNISDLEVASNYQGGFEITLSYTGKGPQLKNRRIPCERF